MGRPRSFSEDDVLERAAETFGRRGYAGTSIDDLVQALGIHRGSLYKAFGSKQGLFRTVLSRAVDALAGPTTAVELVTEPWIDLVLVAALELAAEDEGVRHDVERACSFVAMASGPRPPTDVPDAVLTLVGARLLRRAHL